MDKYTNMSMTGKKMIKAKSFRHNQLKILEIYGFVGSALEVRFAKYLIRSVVSVEKIVINTGYFKGSGMDAEIQGREQAKLLCALLKPGTELEVRGYEDKKYFWSNLKG